MSRMETLQARLASMRSRRTLALGAARAFWHLVRVEHAEGSLRKTVALARRKKSLTFAQEWTFAELLEWAARTHGSKTFLEYGDERISFASMNARANRVAHSLLAAGIGPGSGVGLMLSNQPSFLETFFAVQKLGGYAVPVNIALVDDGLAYILDHSEVTALVSEPATAAKVAAVRARVPRLGKLWVDTAESPADTVLPVGALPYSALTRGPSTDLGTTPPPDAPALLLYTSGTTGLPKAVVTTHGSTRVKALGMMANLLYDKSDKLYTCLPLFHANALVLTVMHALWVGIPLTLGKRFSASRFWREVGECGATQFNTVGSMIPILLKTPPSAADRAHKVRRVVSAACPAAAWRPFEERFGVEIWEAYGAVDGAGVTIFNAGNAPIGSLGKPGPTMKWRLVDDAGRQVPAGKPGELWVQVGNRAESRVPYWKNEQASSEKVVSGWLHTGDLMTVDPDGYLYFVGRHTDSMRHRGENVSAYEVEQVVDRHPDVLESAAFGVPSPVGEQDIMVSVVLVEGHTLDPQSFVAFLREHLPKYAVPSYLDIVTELPKTGTHRVIKAELRERGVGPRTLRLQEETQS